MLSIKQTFRSSLAGQLFFGGSCPLAPIRHRRWCSDAWREGHTADFLPPGGRAVQHRYQRGGCTSQFTHQACAALSTTHTGEPSVADGASGSTLSAAELHRAARLARLSGLAYLPPDQLDSRLTAQGLKLIANGTNHFTRWFIADGCVNPQQASSKASRSKDSQGQAQQGSDLQQQPDDGPTEQPASLRSPAFSSGADQGHRQGGTLNDGGSSSSNRERLVVLRGVSWRSGPEADNLRLWGQLLRCWPAPFAEGATPRRGVLLAHRGVAEMADSLYQQLLPDLSDTSVDSLTFAGHSLGGALAMLMCALTRLLLHTPPAKLSCHTFGAPPVLSHASGKGGNQVLQVLGLPASCMRGFVLDNDPIPRAMLTVDPSFSIMQRLSVVQNLLQLREWVFGEGVQLSPTHFLFDNVGQVFLIRWNQHRGQEVLPLDASQVDEQLSVAWADMLQRPTSAMAAWLDHYHGSYAQELEGAARRQSRAEGRNASLRD